MTSRTLPTSVAVLVVSFALVGCARKTAVTPPPAIAAAVPAPVESPPPAPAAEATPASTPAPVLELRPVFFELDSYALTGSAREALDANAAMLRKQTAMTVIIEGHCDERGTVEYNQALGERRANAARDYLVASEIAATRIEVISYGKSRPFADGSGESAWAQNRRAHFVVSSQGQAAAASR
jgi:peptidoglycan-associated lipoprotein